MIQPHRDSVVLPPVQLEITRGQARHRYRSVNGPIFLIGSSPDCDLVLGDPQFSSIHAYLLHTSQGLVLRRLSADPEVTVGGRPVVHATLIDGDRIRTGPYEFRVRIVELASLTRRPRSAPARTPDAVTRLLDDIRQHLVPEQPTDRRSRPGWQAVTAHQPMAVSSETA